MPWIQIKIRLRTGTEHDELVIEKASSLLTGQGAMSVTYTDAGDISAWALEALQWANGAGLISGRSSTLLAPAGSTTRAETAVILVRFLEQIAP